MSDPHIDELTGLIHALQNLLRSTERERDAAYDALEAAKTQEAIAKDREDEIAQAWREAEARIEAVRELCADPLGPRFTFMHGSERPLAVLVSDVLAALTRETGDE